LVTEVFDPSTNTWTALSYVPSLTGVGACLVVGGDDNLYVFGGTKSKLVQRYNPKTSLWDLGTAIPANTIYEGCTVLPSNPFMVSSTPYFAH
jgi:hypothetical protein